MAWVVMSDIRGSQKQWRLKSWRLMLSAISACLLILVSPAMTSAASDATHVSGAAIITVTQRYNGFVDDFTPNKNFSRHLNPFLSENGDAPSDHKKHQSLRALIWNRILIAADLVSGKMEAVAAKASTLYITEDANIEKTRKCVDKNRYIGKASNVLQSPGADLAEVEGSEKKDPKTERKKRKRTGFFAF